MRAVTIQQPEANDIAQGLQWVYSCEWSTAHRGLLAIHAAAKSDSLNLFDLRRYETSAILAVGEMVACVQRAALVDQGGRGKIVGTDIMARDVLRSQHAGGPWLWIFRDVVQLRTPFRQVTGSVGIWPLLPRHTAQLRSALEVLDTRAAKRRRAQPVDVIEPEIPGLDGETYCIEQIDGFEGQPRDE